MSVVVIITRDHFQFRCSTSSTKQDLEGQGHAGWFLPVNLTQPRTSRIASISLAFGHVCEGLSGLLISPVGSISPQAGSPGLWKSEEGW